jgi:hypothetical protein
MRNGLRSRRFVFLILSVALSSSDALAQQAARAAVAHPQRATPASDAGATRDSSRALAYHIKRGATYGTISGAALAGLVAIVISRADDNCCERPRSHFTLRQSVGIIALGSAAGAVVGAILGYSYHFKRDP